MQEAKRMLFWENDVKFGIRMGHNLSYLDTLQYIDNNDMTLLLDFTFNGQPSGPQYFYVWCTGSSSWYSMEYGKLNNNIYGLYCNIGSSTFIAIPHEMPYKFGQRTKIALKTGSSNYEMTGTYEMSGKYAGTIVQDKTLTVATAVNRNLQEGAKPTIKDALEWIRSDITVFGLRILKENNIVFNLQPMMKNDVACFKDTISQKLFYSNGPDAFEIDENIGI